MGEMAAKWQAEHEARVQDVMGKLSAGAKAYVLSAEPIGAMGLPLVKMTVGEEVYNIGVVMSAYRRLAGLE